MRLTKWKCWGWNVFRKKSQNWKCFSFPASSPCPAEHASWGAVTQRWTLCFFIVSFVLSYLSFCLFSSYLFFCLFLAYLFSFLVFSFLFLFYLFLSYFFCCLIFSTLPVCQLLSGSCQNEPRSSPKYRDSSLLLYVLFCLRFFGVLYSQNVLALNTVLDTLVSLVSTLMSQWVRNSCELAEL